jgi:hypothetical protein
MQDPGDSAGAVEEKRAAGVEHRLHLRHDYRSE